MDPLENREGLPLDPIKPTPVRPSMAPNPFFQRAADLDLEESPAPEAVPPVQPAEAVITSVPAPAAQPIAQPAPAAPTVAETDVTPVAPPISSTPPVTAPQAAPTPVPPAANPYTIPSPTYIPPAPVAKKPEEPAYYQEAAKAAKKASASKAKRSGVWKTLIAGVLVLALVIGSCVVTASILNAHWEEKYQDMTTIYSTQLTQMQTQIDNQAAANEALGESVSGSPGASAEGLSPSQVYAQNVDSVVAVTCTLRGGYSTGTGFILSSDGYVVTNYHVIEGARSVDVVTHDGFVHPAEVIGYDAENDLAVVKVDVTDWPAVTLGSSDALIVGDQVVAIGNPLGELTSTLTVGYISAKERAVTTDGITIHMLQTDAAINSGNSGGPLFNMRGEVVGITTAKYSGESSSGATIEGIGFAIPMDDVYPLITDLITHGYVTSAYLGVMVSNMDPAAAQADGVPMGAYVREVTPGYCAEAAGLLADDIIVAIGSYQIESINDLTKALRYFEAGDTTTLTVFRNGEELVLTITLDEKPKSNTAIPTSSDVLPENGSFEEWYAYFSPFYGE